MNTGTGHKKVNYLSKRKKNGETPGSNSLQAKAGRTMERNFLGLGDLEGEVLPGAGRENCRHFSLKKSFPRGEKTKEGNPRQPRPIT